MGEWPPPPGAQSLVDSLHGPHLSRFSAKVMQQQQVFLHVSSQSSLISPILFIMVSSRDSNMLEPLILILLLKQKPSL